MYDPVSARLESWFLDKTGKDAAEEGCKQVGDADDLLTTESAWLQHWLCQTGLLVIMSSTASIGVMLCLPLASSLNHDHDGDSYSRLRQLTHKGFF